MRWRGRVVVAIVALVSQQGCTSELEGIDTRAQALNARISYGGTCTPFAALQWQRGAFYARVVAASNAFDICLRNTLQARYTPLPGDPNAALAPAQRIAAIMTMYSDFNNHVSLVCNDDGEVGASVPALGTYGTYENREIDLGIGGGTEAAAGYHEAEGDWVSLYGRPGNEFMPWQWRAGDLIHEFAHSHGYDHIDGNEGVPYIADSCAAAVVEQSHRRCGKATTHPLCAEDQLRLLTGWSGTSADAQSAMTTCTCSSDPLRLVSFRTHNGTRLSAIDGGGREIRTNETISLGPWQTFFLIDNRRGTGDPTNPDRAQWWQMDQVQIKSWDGSWTTADFDATGSGPTILRVGFFDWGPWRTIRSGDLVHISSTDANGARRWASDDGTQLTATTLIPGPDEEFYVDVYRRDTMVYLRTTQNEGLQAGVDGRYIEGRDDRKLYNDTTDLHRYTADRVEPKRRSAFWLIDWNGGALTSGDSVSFEQFRDDSWHYWSSHGVGGGQMWLRHSVGPDERFTMSKVAGSTGPIIGHNDSITLRTSAGRFVTAWPALGAFFVTAGGVEPGAWQRFTLSLVQHHDRFRPTW